MDGECKQSWIELQLAKAKKQFAEDCEKLAYTAAEGSTLDLIWKGEFNTDKYMSKTKTKGFDVPAGFPIPLSKSVILAKRVGEFKTKNGLYLDQAAEENNVAILMAAAHDCNPQLTPGTKVMYNINENRTILFEDTSYLIMHEMALFCILPENAILMPETVHASVKKTREFNAHEKSRKAEMERKELNQLDKISEAKKKIFAKKK